MKKYYSVAIVLSALVTFLGGCGSTPDKVQAPAMQGEFANAPKWVMSPQMEGGLAATGSAKMSKAGMSFTRTAAMANGRDELARMMNVKVKNMVKNFTQATGIGDDETVERVASNVSKQVTKQVLSGSRMKDSWISPSSELYVFIVLDPTAAAEAVKQSVQTSYKNEKALWQQFQAKKAQEELDAEIEKEFGDFKGE